MIQATPVLVRPRRPVLDRNDHQGLPAALPPALFRLESRMDRQALGKIADVSVETFDHCGKG